MERIKHIIRKINFNRVLAVLVLVMIFSNVADFRLLNLEIQSQKLNKRICIQEMIPTNANPIPLEVIR
jgi:hypothetical protein